MLTDFIVELSEMSKDSLPEPRWILETDGSSKAVGGGAGMVLQSLEGLLVAQTVKFSFLISNNMTQYEAVLLGLRAARVL